ncbi:rod shape-determining protein MreD [Candidatus Gottesmanbacteria bacterium]|nr:rod shape-determining protein MreD [Candidatus Gottesmanbacteria bacterium]
MWKFIILFTIILAFILESLTNLPLLLVVVIALSSFAGPKTGVLSSFICGLLSDLGTGKPLGMTVIFFLIASFIIMLYKRRLKQESLLFMFVYSFIMVNLYLILFQRSGYFYPIQSAISAFIVIISAYILYNIKSSQ